MPDHERRRAGGGGAASAVRLEAGRTGAHLRAVHGLATRLNRLNESGEIGEAIAAELRELIDYHNCRVYLLHPDEDLLVPVAFQGDVDVDPEQRVEALTVCVGEGITGWVAETGQTG